MPHIVHSLMQLNVRLAGRRGRRAAPAGWFARLPSWSTSVLCERTNLELASDVLTSWLAHIDPGRSYLPGSQTSRSRIRLRDDQRGVESTVKCFADRSAYGRL